MRLRVLVVAGVTVAALAFAGCAQPGYDARRIQRQLREAGLTADQARCVTEGLETNFDPRELASHTEPSDEARSITRDILERCGVNPAPPPD